MDTVATPRRTRVAASTVAIAAWLGLIATVAVSWLGDYSDHADPGMYGNRPLGSAGALGRVFDTLSYFTIWSNIVVAIAFTLLARRPDADTRLRRTLILDALMMITVTAIVYALVIAPSVTLTGWSRLTNPWQHILVPILTVGAWLIFGPRNRVDARTVAASVLVPLGWIVFMLIRGAIDHTYPYGFTNVTVLGYPKVILVLLVITAFGLGLSLLY